ncbi:hypothetical protein Bbelb_267250 [Branchiostoma belcheri]|nr:hypothetical protein Bbelb_267250 [Branchiostoma belcheri]
MPRPLRTYSQPPANQSPTTAQPPYSPSREYNLPSTPECFKHFETFGWNSGTVAKLAEHQPTAVDLAPNLLPTYSAMYNRGLDVCQAKSPSPAYLTYRYEGVEPRRICPALGLVSLGPVAVDSSGLVRKRRPMLTGITTGREQVNPPCLPA